MKTDIRLIYLFLIVVLLEAVTSLRNYGQEDKSPITSSGNSGLNLLPIPQKMTFSGKSFLFTGNWILEPVNNVSPDDPAIGSLVTGLKERAGIELNSNQPVISNNQEHHIRITVKAGSVQVLNAADTNNSSIIDQAYRLKLDESGIDINSNTTAGLFYGIQTLLQLFSRENGQIFLPQGEIHDWPDLELRMIYWDCAHHLEKPETFKRVLKQASYYKINAFALKLEGHFQFKNAGPVVEPYAMTPEEYQELTDYAKAHFIELIPYLDAPAHDSFILKHPEYAGLRAFPNSNYEFSVTNQLTYDLLSGMFYELIQANKGGKYILFSTDEAYYVGKAENEKEASGAAGSNGKLLAGFITRISGNLTEKGRKVIFWGEYPLTSSDINALPSGLINGEYNSSWAPAFKQRGIGQLIYTSTQGVEPLFPNYYMLPDKETSPAPVTPVRSDDEQQQPDASKGRVDEMLKTIYGSVAGGKSDITGLIIAAWADAGLHPETFWLGYTTGAASAWNLTPTTARDLINRFFLSFYGKGIYKMDRIYQLLSTQAEFWNKSWVSEPSKLRTPIIGNSKGIYDIPKPATDQTLPVLPVPDARKLTLTKDWSADNLERLQSAEVFLKENDELIDLLKYNIRKLDYQKHNLQVMLSVAMLCRQNLTMLKDLQQIDKALKQSSENASSSPATAVAFIDQALDKVKVILLERNESLRSLTDVWYEDWYPVAEEANGRKYLFQVDDIKDHLPVRTIDISYLIYREIHYPLGKWAEEVRNVRNQYAIKNHLQVRPDTIDWESY